MASTDGLKPHSPVDAKKRLEQQLRQQSWQKQRGMRSPTKVWANEHRPVVRAIQNKGK